MRKKSGWAYIPIKEVDLMGGKVENLMGVLFEISIQINGLHKQSSETVKYV